MPFKLNLKVPIEISFDFVEQRSSGTQKQGVGGFTASSSNSALCRIAEQELQSPTPSGDLHNGGFQSPSEYLPADLPLREPESITTQLVKAPPTIIQPKLSLPTRETTLAFTFTLLTLGVAFCQYYKPAFNWVASNLKRFQVNKTMKVFDKSFHITPQNLDKLFSKESFTRPGVKGQVIAGYVVTDTYRVRMTHPSTGQKSNVACAGKSIEEIDEKGIHGCIAHRGLDIGTPYGTPVRAIAPPDSIAKVTCHSQLPWGTFALSSSPGLPGWEFIDHHLSKCYPGTYKSGAVFGNTGSAGTGPHDHFAVSYQGKSINPPIGFAIWRLQGFAP